MFFLSLFSVCFFVKNFFLFVLLENSYNKLFHFSMSSLKTLFQFFQCLHAIFKKMYLA